MWISSLSVYPTTDGELMHPLEVALFTGRPELVEAAVDVAPEVRRIVAEALTRMDAAERAVETIQRRLRDLENNLTGCVTLAHRLRTNRD
jgi:alkyl hydroperoxide reductase subunit AhpF